MTHDKRKNTSEEQYSGRKHMHVSLVTFDASEDEPLSNGTPEETLEESNNTSSTNKKKKLEYNKYSDEQIMRFINLMIEGKSVKAAAKMLGITKNSAYRYRKMWNDNGITPTRNKRGPPESVSSKFTDEHTQFIVHYIDHEPNTVAIAQVKDALVQQFPELQASSSHSALLRHMKAHCCLALKRIHKPINDSQEVDTMAAAIESWLNQTKEMNFDKNCVFIGEASYAQHYGGGWVAKVNQSVEKAKPSQGVSITILGAISAKGVIDVSLRKATLMSGQKRRADGSLVLEGDEEDQPLLGYLQTVMEVLTSHGLSGYYLVMDSELVHRPAYVAQEIERRGFQCAYSRSFFPFPNPIERFWSTMLKGIDRAPFGPDDQLSMRIMSACSTITSTDCRGWIREAGAYLPQKLISSERI